MALAEGLLALGGLALVPVSFWGTWWLIHPSHAEERLALIQRRREPKARKPKKVKSTRPGHNWGSKGVVKVRLVCFECHGEVLMTPAQTYGREQVLCVRCAVSRPCTHCQRRVGAAWRGKDGEAVCLSCSAVIHHKCRCIECHNQLMRMRLESRELMPLPRPHFPTAS